MKKYQFAIGVLLVIGAVFGIYFVLSSEYAVVTHPKGIIAEKELEVIIAIILLMLIVVVPTLIFLFTTVWRHRPKKVAAKYDPEHSYGAFGEVILWIIPTIVVIVMIFVNWNVTHELDPFKPIQSENKPLKIQVVALDWKWLFIYPEQGIAAVNFVQFPEKTPLHFVLAADDSPMNSFWLPQLSGQIYSMTGMATQIHMMANEPGEFVGRAAEINGQGYANMTFLAKATTLSDFDAWVKKVKQAPQQLTEQLYGELVKRSENNPVALFSSVDKDLFDKILMKYQPPNKK